MHHVPALSVLDMRVQLVQQVDLPERVLQLSVQVRHPVLNQLVVRLSLRPQLFRLSQRNRRAARIRALYS